MFYRSDTHVALAYKGGTGHVTVSKSTSALSGLLVEQKAKRSEAQELVNKLKGCGKGDTLNYKKLANIFDKARRQRQLLQNET